MMVNLKVAVSCRMGVVLGSDGKAETVLNIQ